jgi:C4-dicarboxylate-specific signal transduction histidine kinase
VLLTSLLCFFAFLLIENLKSRGQSIKAARDQLETLLIEMPIAALVRSGHSVNLNRKAAELLKLSNTTPYKLDDLLDVVGGPSRRFLLQLLSHEPATALPSQSTLSLTRSDQSLRDIRATVSTIGSSVIVLLEDLTEDNERKRSEEEAQAKLAESAKLATLGEMAGGIAHEINNPLAILNGSADILGRLAQSPNPEGERISKQVDMIRRTIARISKIVSGLRVFARDGTSDPFERIVVKELIDETMALCQTKIRSHGIRIEIPVLRDDLSFEGQRVQISQVLLNLVNNAADAIQKQEKPWIRIDVIDQAFDIKIKVVDSGTGIPQNSPPKSCSRFSLPKKSAREPVLGSAFLKALFEDTAELLALNPNRRTRLL